MNLTKLFKTLLALLFLVGMVNAQTFYVNNQTGDDANPGTAGAPKKSVFSALIAAPSGSTIDVAATSLNYIEGNINILGRTYTFTSTVGTGTPTFTAAALNVGSSATTALVAAGVVSAANPAVITSAGHGLLTGDKIYVWGTGDPDVDGKYWTVTVLTANTFSIPVDNTDGAEGAVNYRTQGIAIFSAPFQFNGGLNLNVGELRNGNNVTVGTGVYRTELGSIPNGQLNFTAAIPFTYQDIITGASTIKTGFEFPVLTNRAGALNVPAGVGALTLQLDQDRTVGNGNTAIITAAGNQLDLNGFTLTVVGNSAAHSLGGSADISNGTLKFNMTGGNATVAGAVALPNVLATSTDGTAAAPRVLALAGTTVRSLTAQSNSSINAPAVTTVNTAGNTSNVIVNSSNGIITLNVVTTIHGNVLLDATGVTGVVATNIAQIVFPLAGGALTINGSVTNSVGVVLSGAAISNAGIITFADAAGGTVTINGSVLLNGNLSGNSIAATNYTANGEIRFSGILNDQAVTITGSVTNSATSTAVATVNGGTVSTNFRVLFGNVGSNVRADGGFVNSVNFPEIATTSFTCTDLSNGIILFTARAAGKVGDDAVGVNKRVGAVINNSQTNVASNGLIDFAAAATGLFYGTSVTQGAFDNGGDITFGNHALNLSGAITNNRTGVTTTSGDIIVPAGAGTVAHSIVGGIANNSPAQIVINLTGNDVVSSGAVTSTVAGGVISFPTAGTGKITVSSLNVSAGTFQVPGSVHAAAFVISGGFTMSGGAVDLSSTLGQDVKVGGEAGAAGVPAAQAGNINWTAGTLTLTGRANVYVSGVKSYFGGATTNPAFTGAATTDLEFVQPIPNVNQEIIFGTADPFYTGTVTISNNAVLPAPYVLISSLGGATTPSNFYILGGGAALTFNTIVTLGTDPVNTVQINNVRMNVGKNGVGGAVGNFQNTSGYVTSAADGTPLYGRVMMSGNATGQTVNAALSALGATFGGFGVDNEGAVDGASDVNFGSAAVPLATQQATCQFTGDFYFAQGEIDPNAVVAGAVIFNGPSPYPTIYRTEGLFITNRPVFNSLTNVTYYGFDKTTALEVPNTANRLNNLTVSTSNGAYPGHGVVTLGAAVTVNGNLQVDANQNLYTAGFMLTLAGEKAILNGNLVDNGVLSVSLARANGTAFSGTGSIPSIQINNGSLNNSLSLPGLVSQAFGVDNTINTADDAFTTYDGNITFAAGADAGSYLKVTFAGNGPHFANLNMNGTDPDQTFELGSNAVMSGSMTHAAGAMNLGGFTLTHQGTAPGMTVGATITNGLLYFPTAATNMTVTGPGTAVIGANFQYDDITDNNVPQTFTLLSASTGDLQINGNITLSATTGGGDGAQFDIGAGRTLTAGANVTVGSGSAFIATNGGGTGILLLDAVTPPTEYSTPAATGVANLTVADNVLLKGGVVTGSSTLTVGTAFRHTAGDINIGTANLQVGGSYTRTAGTYSGTGYFIWNSVGAWNNGPAVAYPKLQVAAALNLGATGMVTVNDELWLNNAVLTQTTAGVGYLTIGDAAGALVQVSGAGNINPAAGQIVPLFSGQTDYSFTGAASVPNLFTWPTAQATNVTVNVPAATVTVGANRTILGNVDLVNGTMQWDSPTGITFTDGTTITRRANTALLNRNYLANATLGGFTAGNINLAYQNAVAVGHVITTDIEYSLPTVVNNFSLLASSVATATTTVNIAAGAGAAAGYARTISGMLNMASVLNINLSTTFSNAAQQVVPAGSTVNVNAGTTTWSGGLNVLGTYNNTGTTVAALSGTGAITNTGALNLSLLDHSTGLFTMNPASTVTMTGDAKFGPINVCGVTTYAVAVPPAMPVISTQNNLTFTGVWGNVGGTGAGSYLNVVFTGTNIQEVALGANRNLQNVTLNKGNDGTVTFKGGNLTLNPFVPAVGVTPAVPAGILTLTRGVLVVGNITEAAGGNPAVAALFTIQLTTNGGAPGIITNLGYTRNPANNVDLAHVVGRLGVFVPVNTIGRMEWPVGSTTKYRPAAVTFTAGNFTIAPTTIIVEHVEQRPITDDEIRLGQRPEFPLVGGTKVLGGVNNIGSAVPYYWMFEATTSLGAAQLFNVELNATELILPPPSPSSGSFPSLGNRNHNDLRIMARFFGNVVANRWSIQGSNDTYSNALYENTPTSGAWLAVVRNIGSLGSAISQKAMFTVGLPTQAPIWSVSGNITGAITEADGAGVLNTYTTTQVATDPDVTNAAVTYAVLSVTPAVPSDAVYNYSTTGVFTFKPGWSGGTAAGKAYTFVIQASKAGGDAVTKSIVVTVTNSNRQPSFDLPGGVKLTNESVPYNKEYSIVINAPDPDGGTPIYAVQSVVPALVTAPVINALGKLSFTPVYADLGKVVVVTVTATDADGGVAQTSATYTISAAYMRGNVTGPVTAGDTYLTKPDVTDAIQILEYVVGKRTFTDEQKSIANADLSTEVPTNPTAYDASFILRYLAANWVWPTSKAVATTGTVEFGKLAVQNGTFSLPFNLTNTKGVTSIYAEINIGSNVDVNTISSRLPQDWLIVTNNENGTVKIAAAGVTPLSDGAFATLEMKLKDKEAVVALQGSAVLNDELSASLNAKVREIPSEFALSQNYPNPFNPTTTIKYAVAEDVKVSLVVYDMLGRVVKNLVDGQQEAGFYTMKWDGTNEYGSRVASGIYIYRLQAGSFTSTIKMNLMK